MLEFKIDLPESCGRLVRALATGASFSACPLAYSQPFIVNLSEISSTKRNFECNNYARIFAPRNSNLLQLNLLA